MSPPVLNSHFRHAQPRNRSVLDNVMKDKYTLDTWELEFGKNWKKQGVY